MRETLGSELACTEPGGTLRYLLHEHLLQMTTAWLRYGGLWHLEISILAGMNQIISWNKVKTNIWHEARWVQLSWLRVEYHSRYRTTWHASGCRSTCTTDVGLTLHKMITLHKMTFKKWFIQYMNIYMWAYINNMYTVMMWWINK